MSKKAQFNPVAMTAETTIGLSMFIMMIVFMSFILFKFHTIALTMDFFNVPILSQTFDFMLAYPILFDWVAFFVYGMLFIVSLYLLSRVEIGSVMYVLSFVLLFVAGFAFFAIGVVLDLVVTNAIFVDVVSSMIFIPFYSGNVVLFSMLYGFSCLLALHIPSQ